MPKTTLTMFLCALAALPPAHAEDDVPAGQTVTVSAKKEAVVKKIDKTVYDVSAMPRAANGSAQDVLQATPGLAVSADGQIAVKGSQQVTVLVDGKPAAMLSGSSEERAVALQTMSGADIASVEVITNPSAAYHANGGAIVNIVLKRNRKPGAHGQVQGSAADHGLWNAGASGDATRSGISVHGSVARRHDGTYKERGSEVDWLDAHGGQAGSARQTSTVFVHRVVDSAALGIDDALGDADTVSLSVRHNARRSKPLFDVLNERRTDAGDTVWHRISDGPNEQSDDSASLAYSHQGSATALKAMLQGSRTRALVDKSWRDVFLVPVRDTGYSHGATRTARRLDQATLDWTRTSDAGQWGTGIDVRRKVDAIGNYQAAVDPASGFETPDPLTTNGYTVTTLLSAAYLTDQIRHGPWEALLGGRAERTALRVHAAQDEAPARHWQAFNPSLHLKYAPDDGASLTLAYRRSLQLPDPRALNPFATYVDAQNLSRGNPGLQPQRMSSWEIGAEAGAPQLTGSAGAFYRTSQDTVADARSIDGDVIVTSKQNGGQAASTGVTASLDWTPSAPWKLGADTGVYRATLTTPDLPGLVHQSGVSGWLNLRASWHAGPDDVALDAHAQSAGIAPLGRYGATSSVNVTWKRALSKLLSLTVNANDLFDGSRRTYSTMASTFRQAGFDHFVARRLWVGLVQKIE